MDKFSKDKKDQGESRQPVVGEADFREADPRALVQTFAPMVEPLLVSDLIVNARNARTHSPRQVDHIAACFREFGIINPIVINDKRVVIAGHGRLRGRSATGMKECRL